MTAQFNSQYIVLPMESRNSPPQADGNQLLSSPTFIINPILLIGEIRADVLLLKVV